MKSFFTIKYSKNQNLKCSSSPGDPGCGRPAQGEVELPWCLHSSLLLPGELRSIMMMILMFMVMMTTHDLRISWLSRYKWRLAYIDRLLRYMWEGHLELETMEQDLEVHQGFTNWWELALLVYFSAIFIGTSTFPDTILFKFTKLKYFNNYWPQAPLPPNYVGCLRRVSG